MQVEAETRRVQHNERFEPYDRASVCTLDEARRIEALVRQRSLATDKQLKELAQHGGYDIDKLHAEAEQRVQPDTSTG